MSYKICITLVNRTNYSKIKPILKLMSQMPEFDVRLVVSSALLLEKYGEAYKDILNDGFKIDKKIDCLLMNDSHEAMAKTVSLSLAEHSSYFANHRPDLLMIVGDRFDMTAPALAASLMNIPIAHIQGGEVSGTIDNKIRDLISRMSGLHFVATDLSKERLVKTGLERESIFNFGCPAIEYITSIDVGPSLNVQNFNKKNFKRKIEINAGEKYFVLMIHPDTTNSNDVDMGLVLKTVDSFKIKTFVFYPNVDAHNFKIISAMAKYSKSENFYHIRHLPVEDFIKTLAHSTMMIGNSSSGIREAASFGIPVINIGHRQIGRERNANTIDIPCNEHELKAAIEANFNKRFSKENIYSKKNCSSDICKTIVHFLENKNSKS